MRRLFLVILVCINTAGCVPLIIGAAAGALGGYAVSKDTIQSETDKPYDSLWYAAKTIARSRGVIKEEDSLKGYLKLEIEASQVWIRLIRITRSTTRLRISCRRRHLPNLALAEELYTKIMGELR